MSISFFSNENNFLCVFGKTNLNAKCSCLSLKKKDGECVYTKNISTKTFYDKIDIPANQELELDLQDGEISIAYIFDYDNVLNDGVTYITGSSYNQLHRNQSHFSPVRGWMNDPNGLCFYKEKIHLFHQFNPYNQFWENMHWGHAVSTDLIHWTHLPVVFFPQPDLQDRKDLRGGAYSGSAIIKDEKLNVFFTRTHAAFDRSWTNQWQVKAISDDGVFFHDEHDIIKPNVKGITNDFRDPKVFMYENKYYVVIGGAKDDVPSVFLYRSDDAEKWEFVSVLFEADNEKFAVCECPDFFCVDGKWVLLVSFIPRVRDTKTNIRDMFYYIGDFDGNKFTTEASGLLDYGKDFYAAQSFELHGRRICFGWNPDCLNVYKPVPESANGTLSLPRQFHVKGDCLLQPPAKETEALVGEKLLYENNRLANADVKEFIYTLELQGAKNFSLDLVESGEGNLSVEYEKSVLKIFVGKNERVAIPISENEMRNIKIFVDDALAEFFINDGRYTANLRYYFETQKKSVCELKIEAEKYECSVHKMKTIWGDA